MAIEVRHYSNSFVNENTHHDLVSDFGSSNTDKSFFRPDISSARALVAGSASDRIGLYDFQDGKDTGDRIQVILRQKGLDPTEIDKIGNILQNRSDQFSDADKSELERQALSLDGKKLMDFAKKFVDKYSLDLDTSSSANLTANPTANSTSGS